MKQVSSFEYVFKFSADGILLTDIKGYITGTNKSFEEMLGYKKEELEGMNTSELFPPDLKEQDITREIIEQLKGGKIQSGATQYNWLKKDGESILVELNTALLKDEEDTIIGIISNVRDISKRMVLEEEL